jgi:hypothetical protein
MCFLFYVYKFHTLRRMLIKQVIAAIISVEPLILGFLLYQSWIGAFGTTLLLLWLLVPIYLLRLFTQRRLGTWTLLDPLLAAFIVLMILNVEFAPFTFGYGTLARPLVGMALVVACVEQARRRGSLEGVLVVMLQVGAVAAFLALTSSQWNEKSQPLFFIINTLPVVRDFPGASGGFNANEIGGAMTYLIPLMAGLAILGWRVQGRLPAGGFSLVFAALLLALFLGQSRLSLIGVIVTLAAVIVLLIPHNLWRYLALLGLACFAGLTIYVGVLQSQRLGDRDASSFAGRLEMWAAAAAAIGDHPLTGVGMNTFRQRAMRQLYPVEGYENAVLPHVHNEFIQVTVDLGIPGLLVFSGWFVVAAWMVLATWRHGDLPARAVVVAAAGGLVAHGAFGLADAITLWDRFSFLFWALLGIIVAQYVLTRQERHQPA